MTRPDKAANILRKIREDQGVTLREAAGALGIAPSHLSRLERAERGGSDELLRRAADYYGVPMDVVSVAEGKVPSDILAILSKHPELITEIRAKYGEQGDG